jgi:hypothetical protein
VPVAEELYGGGEVDGLVQVPQAAGRGLAGEQEGELPEQPPSHPAVNSPPWRYLTPTSAIQRMIDEGLGHASELCKHPQAARFGPVLPAPFGCGPQEVFPHVSDALRSRS